MNTHCKTLSNLDTLWANLWGKSLYSEEKVQRRSRIAWWENIFVRGKVLSCVTNVFHNACCFIETEQNLKFVRNPL